MIQDPLTLFRSRWYRTLETLLLLTVGALVVYALYVVFMVVPQEKVMGAVQRIFYFHVGSAVSCYASFALVFAASLGVLATSKRSLDLVNGAAGEVGFLFCTITLVSGMIWAKAAWNTWFRWEPRLVTFLLLWFIFLAFSLLRAFSTSQYRAVHSAIIGLLGSLTVPLVWISVKFLPQVAQLHPQVVERQGLKDPLFGYGLGISVLALVLFQFLLVMIRARLELVSTKAKELPYG